MKKTPKINPQVRWAAVKFIPRIGLSKPLPVGDWSGRRARSAARQVKLEKLLAKISPPPSDVEISNFSCPRPDGTMLPLRLYRRRGSRSLALIIYVHGGGMIMGTVDAYDSVCAKYASFADIAILSVDYRLAPEYPFPAAIEDVSAGVRWARENYGELTIDPKRIGIAGDSAGGGIAAGVLLKARDEGFGLSAGMLIYPMLDDRTIASPVSGPQLTGPFIVWSYDDNITGWRCLLGEMTPGEVSAYAAPARATQLGGLPPIYIEVGDLDIFHDEDVAFASRLRDVGGDVQLHLRPGCPHGYEVVAPKSRIAQLAMQQRYEFLRSFN
jgi:acetyl esterase/lipase